MERREGKGREGKKEGRWRKKDGQRKREELRTQLGKKQQKRGEEEKRTAIKSNARKEFLIWRKVFQSKITAFLRHISFKQSRWLLAVCFKMWLKVIYHNKNNTYIVASKYPS